MSPDQFVSGSTEGMPSLVCIPFIIKVAEVANV